MAGELDARAAGGKRLSDKVCIVTGSGQGIGRATAKRLEKKAAPSWWPTGLTRARPARWPS